MSDLAQPLPTTTPIEAPPPIPPLPSATPTLAEALTAASDEFTAAESAQAPAAEQPVAEGAEAALPAEAAPATPPELEVTDAEALKPDGQSEDGKRLFFSKPKAARLLQSQEAWTKVQDAVPGISPEDVVTYKQSASVLEQMSLDMMSAEPQRVGRFLQHFTQTCPGGIAVMADLMASPQFAQVHPEAAAVIHNKVASEVQSRAPQITLSELNRLAATAPSSEGADWQTLLNAAAKYYAASHNLNPAAQPVAMQPQNGNGAAVDQNNPYAVENAQLKQQMAQRAQADRSASWQAFSQDARSQQYAGTEALIATFIGNRINEKTEPLLYKGAVTELRQAIRDAIASNPTYQNDERALFERASFSASATEREEIRKSLVSRATQYAQRIIAPRMGTVLAQAGKKVVEQNGSDLLKRETLAANGKEPVSGGSPTPQSVVSTPIKPGMKFPELQKSLTEQLHGFAR